MVMILANTACIACYSSDQSTEHSSQVWIETVVRVFMACFVLEMLLKLTAGGNSAGNLADAAIVFAAAGAEMFVLVRGPSNFDQGVQNLGKAIITVRLVRAVNYMDIPGVGNIKTDLTVISRITPLSLHIF